MSRIPPESRTQDKVPFHVQTPLAGERGYVEQALRSGELMAGGAHTRACEALLEERLGVARVLLTQTCTAALELAGMLCELGPGDEVVLPSLTSPSTANAFLRAGAVPVFVDVRPDTLNLDETLVEAALGPRSRAIVAVHYLGVAAELRTLHEICQRHDLGLIEDAAQGIGATYGSHALGSVGRFGALSFHQTKNLGAGEGGALIVRDRADVDRAEITVDKGTDRRAYLRGEVDRYEWRGPGSSFQPSELVAAFLRGQLERLDEITEDRRRSFARYSEALAPLGEDGRLGLPVVPGSCRTNAHGFRLLCRDQAERDALMAALARNGIDARTHFVPLHATAYGRRVGRAATPMQVTEDAARRLLRLPLYFGLTPAHCDRVAETVLGFFGHGAG